MNAQDDLKKYNDPLLSGFNDTKSVRTKTASTAESTGRRSHSNYTLLAVLLAATAVAVLSYFIYNAQTQIGQLSSDLADSRSQLGQVSEELNTSNEQIATLSEGLDASSKKIQSQEQQIAKYRGLYANLKSGQEDQTRELAVLSVQKADQTEVNALKSETSGLRTTSDQLQSKLEETSGAVSRVEETTRSNRSDIDRTRSELESVRTVATSNTTEIEGIKRSLEREYYNFELQEKGGYMKVFDVALSLKDTDPRKRQFDLYLMASGKVIQKKDHSINEPILFYVDGQQKPYEVVVTRVDDKMVVGYLSVPKG